MSTPLHLTTFPRRSEAESLTTCIPMLQPPSPPHAMASTLTTESRSSLRDRRPAVPLLLSSFPLPPSHIPSNPTLLPSPSVTFPHSPLAIPPNPPPSLPPASPLPPIPGPSPVSQHETLLIMSAARSRRTSKMSLNSVSSYSRRSSTASSTSASTSLPSLSPSEIGRAHV